MVLASFVTPLNLQSVYRTFLSHDLSNIMERSLSPLSPQSYLCILNSTITELTPTTLSRFYTLSRSLFQSLRANRQMDVSYPSLNVFIWLEVERDRFG